MIKYRARKSHTITEESIIKETDRFMVVKVDSAYWPKGIREAKESDVHKYFDSFKEAKDWLIKEQQLKLAQLNQQIAIQSSVLIDIESLQEN